MNTIRLGLNRNENRELSIRQVEYAEALLKHPQDVKDPKQKSQRVRLWLYL